MLMAVVQAVEAAEAAVNSKFLTFDLKREPFLWLCLSVFTSRSIWPTRFLHLEACSISKVVGVGAAAVEAVAVPEFFLCFRVSSLVFSEEATNNAKALMQVNNNNKKDNNNSQLLDRLHRIQLEICCIIEGAFA